MFSLCRPESRAQIRSPSDHDTPSSGWRCPTDWPTRAGAQHRRGRQSGRLAQWHSALRVGWASPPRHCEVEKRRTFVHNRRTSTLSCVLTRVFASRLKNNRPTLAFAATLLGALWFLVILPAGYTALRSRLTPARFPGWWVNSAELRPLAYAVDPPASGNRKNTGIQVTRNESGWVEFSVTARPIGSYRYGYQIAVNPAVGVVTWQQPSQRTSILVHAIVYPERSLPSEASIKRTVRLLEPLPSGTYELVVTLEYEKSGVFGWARDLYREHENFRVEFIVD